MAVHLLETAEESGVETASGQRAVVGSMATLRLPDLGAADWAGATKLHDWLLDAHQIEVPVLPLGGSLWVRLSAQVYNTAEDYQRLGAAVLQWQPG